MAKARILIVDDDPDLVHVLSMILEKAGYTVDSAADGKEGMEKVKSSKPDLVILDVMMETPSAGFLMSRKLKKDPERRNIPVLMLTSVKEKTGLDFKPEAGDETWLPVDDYIDKPFKSEAILEKVAKLLKS